MADDDIVTKIDLARRSVLRGAVAAATAATASTLLPRPLYAATPAPEVTKAAPYRTHELWFLVEGVSWGKFKGDEDLAGLVAKVNREDLWREAANALGVPAAQVPQSSSRGVETFFDGKVFDPANPQAYLASLAIKRSG
jgi:hypothetical protein